MQATKRTIRMRKLRVRFLLLLIVAVTIVQLGPNYVNAAATAVQNCIVIREVENAGCVALEKCDKCGWVGDDEKFYGLSFMGSKETVGRFHCPKCDEDREIIIFADLRL